jgi:alpha-tubulin suppressor-like RCC1 family protein
MTDARLMRTAALLLLVVCGSCSACGGARASITGSNGSSASELLSGVAEIAVGMEFTCARMNDGTMRCWGLDHCGSLGVGATTLCAVAGGESAQCIVVPEPIPGVQHVAQLAASDRLCAVHDDGSVDYWEGRDPARPSRIVFGYAVRAVAVGYDGHACGIARDGGAVSCWGRNDNFQLGLRERGDSYGPSIAAIAADAAEVTAGTYSSCARLRDGTVRCWGYLADHRASPNRGLDPADAVPTAIAGVEHATRLSEGGDHACALVDGGALVCWGSNLDGQLGVSGGGEVTPPARVPALGRAIDVAAGLRHTCAILEDRTVQCWGFNDRGQLGDGTTISRTEPRSVLGLSDVAQVSAGYRHTCALRRDGSVWCWGENAFGQLGDGTTIERHAPVAVRGRRTAARDPRAAVCPPEPMF